MSFSDITPSRNRRNFLRTAGMAAGAIAGMSLPLDWLFDCSSNKATAADPIPGRSSSKFKLSLAAYSYRSMLTAKENPITLHDFIDDCAEFGLDAAELTSYYMPESPSDKYLQDLRSHCFRLGLSVSGTAIRNDFGLPPGEKRDAEIQHVKNWIRYAAMLNAPVIRIFAGHQQKNQTEAQTLAWMTEGFQEVSEEAEKYGIYLGLENHGGPTQTAEGLLSLIKSVNSPYFCANLDTGNFVGGGDPYDQMAVIAPYATNVQVKVSLKDSDGKKQPADFNRIADILRAANYRGFVALEYEEPGDVKQECGEYLDKLRQVLKIVG